MEKKVICSRRRLNPTLPAQQLLCPHPCTSQLGLASQAVSDVLPWASEAPPVKAVREWDRHFHHHQAVRRIVAPFRAGGERPRLLLVRAVEALLPL